MTNTKSAINVTYKHIDGVHFFVPADKKALGLCVANVELEIAYAEVGEQLSKIAAFNEGSNEIKYSPTIPFDEFKKLIAAHAAITDLSKYDVTTDETQAWTNGAANEKVMEFA